VIIPELGHYTIDAVDCGVAYSRVQAFHILVKGGTEAVHKCVKEFERSRLNIILGVLSVPVAVDYAVAQAASWDSLSLSLSDCQHERRATATAHNHNPMNRQRLLCGHTVPVLGILEFPEQCHEPSCRPSLVVKRTVGGTNGSFRISMKGPKYYTRLACAIYKSQLDQPKEARQGPRQCRGRGSCARRGITEK
jgi:hypothetical protein